MQIFYAMLIFCNMKLDLNEKFPATEEKKGKEFNTFLYLRYE